MAKRPGAVADTGTGPMPWEEGATPAPAPAPAAGPMPWEEGAAQQRPDPTMLTSGTAPTRTSRRPPTLSEQVGEQTKPGAHPAWDKLTAYNEPDFHHPIQAAGTMAGNLGGAVIKTAGDMFLPGGLVEGTAHFLRHPMDSTKGLVEQISGQPYDPNNADIWPNPRKALHTATDLTAQAGVAGPMAETVGPLTSKVGGVVKGAGRVAGEMTLGTDAMDRSGGVRPGAGVSENRIVAMSRPSLQSKLAARSPQLRAEQMDVLNNSPSAQNAAPIPTRDTINRPFLDTIAQKTNYTTGAGSPPQMSQHWKTMEALNYAQDPKGGILRDPVSHQPIPANIDSHTPGEAGLFLQNMNDMAKGLNPDTLAGRDIRAGAGSLTDMVRNRVPESGPIMDRMNNTDAAIDVLSRQRGARASVPVNSRTLTGLVLDNVYDPARIALGSTAAAGLDLLGSGLKRVGDALTPNGGAGGQGPSTTTPAGPAPQTPTIRGQLNTPPAPLPQGQPLLNAGQTITPAPQPVAGALPGSVEGPLTRVVTRTPKAGGGSSFGPKVEAPAFTKPVGYDTSAMREGIEEENAAHNASRGPSLSDQVLGNVERRKPGLKFEGKAEPEPNQGRRKTDTKAKVDEDGLPEIPTYVSDKPNGRTPHIDENINKVGEIHNSVSDLWDQVHKHPLFGKQSLYATVDGSGQWTGLSASPDAGGASLPGEKVIKLTDTAGNPLKSAIRTLTDRNTGFIGEEGSQTLEGARKTAEKAAVVAAQHADAAEAAAKSDPSLQKYAQRARASANTARERADGAAKTTDVTEANTHAAAAGRASSRAQDHAASAQGKEPTGGGLKARLWRTGRSQ